MSVHSEKIAEIYRLAKKFRGLVLTGISQVGEIPNPKKKAVQDGIYKRRIAKHSG